MSEPLESRDDFEDIRRLVSAETDEAVRRFRAGDFEARLRARIAAGDLAAGEAPKRLLRLRPLAVPAIAAALVLLLAGGAFLIFHQGWQGRGEAPTLVKALGMLPGLESVAAGPERAVPGRRIGLTSAGPVAGVLGQAYAEKKEEENRTKPAPALAAPRLSLKKKMEILFKDRTLERVLLSIHERSKEV